MICGHLYQLDILTTSNSQASPVFTGLFVSAKFQLFFQVNPINSR
jgi:hypothetical protein